MLATSVALLVVSTSSRFNSPGTQRVGSVISYLKAEQLEALSQLLVDRRVIDAGTVVVATQLSAMR